MSYPRFVLAGPVYQIAPRTPDHFLGWLASLPDDLLIYPMSMDANLVALYFRLGMAVEGFERMNGYSVDINGYRWLVGESWLAEVAGVGYELGISCTQHWYAVALGTVRQNLVDRLGQIVITNVP